MLVFVATSRLQKMNRLKNQPLLLEVKYRLTKYNSARFKAIPMLI